MGDLEYLRALLQNPLLLSSELEELPVARPEETRPEPKPPQSRPNSGDDMQLRDRRELFGIGLSLRLPAGVFSSTPC